jgi:predicted transcriptional regulator
MEIELSENVEKKLDEIAAGANLPLKTAIEYILQQYVENPGSAIYAGTWRSAKGMRYVVQWPYLSGFLKLKEDQLVGRE